MSHRRLRRAVLSVSAAALLAGAGAALSSPAGVDATVKKLADHAHTERYPVYDARGRQIRTTSWRVTHAGGNCCEVYVASTAKGRLLEFGGSYPLFSDDRGESWSQVSPIQPVVTGEGAITTAPNGDIVGIGWDPYGGDHLQAFKYDAEAKKWQFAESPLHSPFFDRPWISAITGPFTINGTTTPYITIVRGGTVLREVELISTDGLTYTSASSRSVLSATGTKRTGALKVVADREVDWLPGHMHSRITPLAGGGALHLSSGFNADGDLPSTCSASTLDASANWVCAELPGGPLSGVVRSDSRGWLHEVSLVDDGKALRYRLSRDGGATWRTTVLKPPRGGAVFQNTGTPEPARDAVFPVAGSDFFPAYDVKVNGKLGVAAIHAHVDMPNGTQQDMVFRVDYRSGTPTLREVLYLGLGDLTFAADVTGSAGDRFDFPSIALMPDGRIAATFDDSTTSHEPAMAIER